MLVNQEIVRDLAVNDPNLFEELSMKRSTTFKDPEKNNLNPSKTMWSTINQYPTK